MLTLADPLEHAKRVHPQKLAVIDGEARMTYAQLYERCRRLGAALRRLGLQTGDRVAILAGNGHRYVEALCGIPSAGLVLVPLNTRLALPELEAIVDDCAARVLLTDRPAGSLAAHVERVIPLGADYEALLQEGTPWLEPTADEDALAALFYTGGTTGSPKGVMLTHRNLVANAFHKALACSLRGDDVYLAAPAMFHVAGIAPLLSLIWLGARTVTLPSFEPEACLDAIERHAVTLMIPVPTMLASLTAAQHRKPRNVDSLRLLGHAGSPITSEQVEAAHRVFARAELAQFYGATETASVVTALRNEQSVIGTARMGSCGQATPGVAVRVVRDDGSECALGEVGEVIVRGPNVTIGYWGKPEATRAALRDGYYHTGDLGLLRDDGYLFVVDRLKDMIVSGAENVYSIEVEDVLARHPAVVEVAVFGIPDATWGEAVHAVVVVTPEFASDPERIEGELRAFCRQSIAAYKVPKRIDVQAQPLPKSGPGKVLKRVLREPFWRGSAHSDAQARRM